MRIPNKKELITDYNHAQKCGKILLAFEILITLLVLSNIQIPILINKTPEILILIGIAILPTLLSLAYLLVKNKKKVQDLKPTTKYGHLTKTDIIEVCDIACNKMNIKTNDVHFYVTSEKQVNASALTLGLGFIIKSLQTVMLNRATLHALKKDELISVVAHELAHIYRYPLIHQQALIFRLISSAVFSIGIFAIVPNVFIVAIINGIYQGFVSNWFNKFSTTIEFLCDDTGAEIAGIEPALRAEFLISKHSETLSDALYHLLKARREGHTLNSKDLARLLEDSLSYDCVSTEELNSQIESKIKNHQTKTHSSFFEYFKSQMLSDSLDTDNELEEDFQNLKKSRERNTLTLPESHKLDLTWFNDLITSIRNSPDLPIFRTPEDYSDSGSSHPGPRRRILYLWQEFVDKKNQTSL